MSYKNYIVIVAILYPQILIFLFLLWLLLLLLLLQAAATLSTKKCRLYVCAQCTVKPQIAASMRLRWELGNYCKTNYESHINK